MEEEDFSKLSLAERWSHPKWKARQSAYQEAIKLINQGELLVGVDEMRQCSSDANVVALESGIGVVLAFLTSFSEPQPSSLVLNVRQACIRQLSEKGLVAAKPAVKQAAMDTILAAVEVADPNGVVNDLLESLKIVKSPKAVSALLTALNQIYALFGSPVADVAPVLKLLPAFFANTDRSARQSASDLAVTLCRWTKKDTMLQVLKGIKPVQINELIPRFETVDFSSQPPRLTRGQAATLEAMQAHEEAGNSETRTHKHGNELGGVGGDGDASMADTIDPWDLETPVDVLAKIPSSFFTDIDSKKWKERFEALEPFASKLEATSRISKNDEKLSELAPRLLQIALKDMNISCSTSAIKALGALANGMRGDFAPYSQRTLESAVERFKDKKQTTVEVITQCLDAVFLHALGRKVSPILDVVLDVGMSHRTPTVKLESTNYLAHFLCECSEPFKWADLQRIVPVNLKLLGETSEPLRDAAAKVLAALVKIAGPSKMDPALAKLDEHKRKRVTTWVEKIEVKAKAAPTAPAAPSVPVTSSNHAVPVASATSASVGPTQKASAQKFPQRPVQKAIPRPIQRTTTTTTTSTSKPPASVPTSRALPRLIPPHAAPVPTSSKRAPVPVVADEFTDESDTDLSDIASPGPRNPVGEKPSLNSTPRMSKRTFYSAGITPGRGYDNYRRRMDSPMRSPANGGATSTAAHEIEELRTEIARISAEASSERTARLEAEKRLAEAQVMKENTISQLRDEIAGLKLHIKTQRAEFEQWVGLNDTAVTSGITDRLNTLHLEPPQPASTSHAPVAQPSSHPSNPVYPRIDTRRPRSLQIDDNTRLDSGNSRRSVGGLPVGAPRKPIDNHVDPARRRPIRPISQNMAANHSDSEEYREISKTRDADWERAILMTQKLKKRVEDLKNSRLSA